MAAEDDPPVQMTKADVDRLWQARNYDAIDRARQAGQLDDLLAGKTPSEGNSK